MAIAIIENALTGLCTHELRFYSARVSRPMPER
jgi:hypothetical protein